MTNQEIREIVRMRVGDRSREPAQALWTALLPDQNSPLEWSNVFAR
ncbi:MAG: hypothetical protein AAF050_16340 [Cyanobacteria bacterium J06649_5]